ncbi:MAG: peroxiredoxin [Planctomycetes bacterium]|nr:peroxiredoxin [Planctomycetota bacterium]
MLKRALDAVGRERPESPFVLAGLLTCAVALGCASAPAQATDLFRSLDGADNNPFHPDWGKAGAVLLRTTRAAYSDGRGAPAGADRPSARAISNTVVAQSGSRPNRVGASSFLWQWGQFIDHDMVLTETHDTEALDIPVPMGDAWFDPSGSGTTVIPMKRSTYTLVGERQLRQQQNAITAFLDGSQVYGSDLARAIALTEADGRLRTSSGNLLPFNTALLPNAPYPSAEFFLAGDVRANEQVGLIAMHTLFMREHNTWVARFRANGASPLLAYQVARALVGAEIQAITYREFLPVLLGGAALRPYRGYREGVIPDLANEFAAAAFRLGHSMLPSQLLRLDARRQPITDGHLALRDAFFAPTEVVRHGIAPILRGLAHQPAEEVDVAVVDEVRNFLFGGVPGTGGFDLAALNIQRGRDHGLPSYVEACRQLGRPVPRSFAEITRDPSLQRRLRDAYGTIDKVDLWVGGLAEDHVDGAMVGGLFHRILVDQFERLRDGDRFFYERLPADIVHLVESRSLARIIRDNSEIRGEIPDDVFRVRPAPVRSASPSAR